MLSDYMYAMAALPLALEPLQKILVYPVCTRVSADFWQRMSDDSHRERNACQHIRETGMGPLASLENPGLYHPVMGPFGTMMLADLGADVVCIESPTRIDLVRAMPPFDDQGTAAWHGVLGRNKRSLALDLKQPGAAAVDLRLVETYDIVLEGFRPGRNGSVGIGYEALKR